MDDTNELRRRATLARWAASFRTDGGHEADDHLRALADKLEHDARERDRLSVATPLFPRPAQ